MGRTTGICVAGLLLAAAPARAADEDTQLWITGTLAMPVATDLSGSLDLSQRFRDRGDQQLLRGILDYRLSPAVSVGGGVSYVWNDGPNELRPHQQVTLTFGMLSARMTLEERLYDGADRAELRLRERARLTVPVGKATRVAGTAELLYILQPRDRVSDARVDSWRGTLAVQRKLSAHFEGSLGYLLVYIPRAGAADRISHVPQLGLTWRP